MQESRNDPLNTIFFASMRIISDSFKIYVPYLFLKNRRRSPASVGLREAPTFHRQRKVTMSAEVQPARCGVWDWTVDRCRLMTRLIVSGTSGISLAQFFFQKKKKLFSLKVLCFLESSSRTQPLVEHLLFLEMVLLLFQRKLSPGRSPPATEYSARLLHSWYSQLNVRRQIIY